MARFRLEPTSRRRGGLALSEGLHDTGRVVAVDVDAAAGAGVSVDVGVQ
jgi:hypothetical protein